jgi:hypothetical protein
LADRERGKPERLPIDLPPIAGAQDADDHAAILNMAFLQKEAMAIQV